MGEKIVVTIIFFSFGFVLSDKVYCFCYSCLVFSSVNIRTCVILNCVDKFLSVVLFDSLFRV